MTNSFLAQKTGKKGEFIEGDMKNEGPVKAIAAGKGCRRTINRSVKWADFNIPTIYDPSLSNCFIYIYIYIFT